jgi:hypothetical protein
MNVYSRYRPIAAFAMALSLQVTARVAWSQTATGAAAPSTTSTAAPSATTASADSTSSGSSLTDWFHHTVTFSGEVRSRWEGGIGSNFAVTPASSDVLLRTRLGMSVKPIGWLRFFVQAQDSRALFYKTSPSNIVSDPFDFRQAWAEIGGAEPDANGMRLRVGRQDLVLGSGRLINSGDWSTWRVAVSRRAVSR